MPASDFSDWLTKQQAAEALGVSTKTLEQWAQRGRLQQASWKRPGGGARITVYHPADVARLRQERQPGAPAFVVPAVPAAAGNGRAAEPTALAAPLPPVEEILRALVGAVVRAASEKSEKSENTRLFLTLDEAAEASGLPRAYLRRLIAEGKLEAIKSRGWRIRRRDLDQL